MKYLPWAIAALLAFFMFRGYQAQGVLKERIAAREKTIEALAKSYGQDTVRLVKWKTHYDTLKSQVAGGDSTKIPELIVTADSTIQACTVALGTCDQIRRENDKLKVDLKKRKGSRFGCAGPVAINSKGFGLGLGCGVRF